MSEAAASGHYAHLPEDLIKKILDAVPATVGKMNSMFDVQDDPVREEVAALRENGLVRTLSNRNFTDSLIAVDGGNVIERMSGTDVLLAVAVGVDGLTLGESAGWRKDRNQYYQWQTVMAHDEAAQRLCQGVMFLMELSVLAGANHEIRIMDGAHFTPILKVNSMLSAREESAGLQYVGELSAFLKETYRKVIPDIPDMVAAALNDESVIAFAKYSSSRDILDGIVKRPDAKPNAKPDITVDDKTFFTLGLKENEYVGPFSVGQSSEERRKIWDDLHIKCNLDIPEREELNRRLDEAVNSLRTKDEAGAPKKSELWFTYYKPHDGGPACRIECKRALAEDRPKFERMLLSVKRQIVYPDIREPFPQYLADLMAKSVSGGLEALQDAIRLSPKLNIQGSKFDLLMPYRSKS